MKNITTDIIIEGDARLELPELPAEYFQACVTSPPYWGLRDYDSSDQIGAEPSLNDYIDALVQIFREVRRVLREDGCLWLNIGDGYTSGDRGWRAADKKNPSRAMQYRPPTPSGLKPKDLLGIPWRVAFALQKDGWYLRSDVVWNKPNAQPESVKDRPTRSHEYLFFLSKTERYFYDRDAVKEPSMSGTGLRNKRSVWSVPTKPSSLGHFAMFPPALIEPCVLGSTRPGDWVLDPFFGSGTVGLVAKQRDRHFVGIELNRQFVNIARTRLIDSQLERSAT